MMSSSVRLLSKEGSFRQLIKKAYMKGTSSPFVHHAQGLQPCDKMFFYCHRHPDKGAFGLVFSVLGSCSITTQQCTVPLPPVLAFDSWWNEGKERMHITISFESATGICTARCVLYHWEDITCNDLVVMLWRVKQSPAIDDSGRGL